MSEEKNVNEKASGAEEVAEESEGKVKTVEYSKLDYANMTDEDWEAHYRDMDPSHEFEFVSLGPPVGREIIDD